MSAHGSVQALGVIADSQWQRVALFGVTVSENGVANSEQCILDLPRRQARAL